MTIEQPGYYGSHYNSPILPDQPISNEAFDQTGGVPRLHRGIDCKGCLFARQPHCNRGTYSLQF